jgi:hypothetical protein
MKLPNGEASIVEIEKLRDDCLNPGHPRGRHKARVFRSLLEITAAHAEELRTALVDAALKENATTGAFDILGTRYIVIPILVHDETIDAIMRFECKRIDLDR